MSELLKELSAVLEKAYETESMMVFSEFFSGELHTLRFLSKRTKDEVYPSTLSDVLHVSRARITASLSSLRSKGFITMELCENDRRRMRVTISEDGMRYLAKKQENLRLYLKCWTERFGEDNTRELIRLINLSIDSGSKQMRIKQIVID
jgi:DNA-binding MarR family transcriptional regulator